MPVTGISMPVRSEPARGWRSALLALASLCLALLLLEGAARVLRAGRGPSTGTEFSTYTEYDPLLGWRKRPGSHVRFQRREYATDLVINSRGLRGPERPYERPAGTFRLLALGDSYVEGYAVQEPETVRGELESSLGRPGCPVEVLNGGTVGYSTDQELLFYRGEGRRYAPQVVVLFLYYNDILNNDVQSAGGPKPVFVFRHGALELYRNPVPRPPAHAAAAPGDAHASEEPGGSELAAWVRERLWFGAPRAYNAIGRLGLWAPNRPIGARLELRVYERRRIPQIEGGWEKTRALLAALHHDVAADGARLLVAYVPNHLEVDDRAWTLSQQRYGMDEKAWDRAQVLRRLAEITAQVGLPLLDLSPDLRPEESRLFGEAYFPQDGHWNATGHRLAARAVGRWLGERGWLPACAPRG